MFYYKNKIDYMYMYYDMPFRLFNQLYMRLRKKLSSEEGKKELAAEQMADTIGVN